MLASDVLTKCRYTLSDTDKSRWSDARLLSLLDDGIKDIAKRTILFTEKLFYQVNNLQVDIDLKEYAVKITRVEYLDDELPVYSFDEMDDKYGEDWQLDTGEKVLALVTDHQERGVYKIYPIVSNALNPHVVYTSLFGVTTDISYSDIQPVLASVYGDISHVPDEALITFYYVRKHANVTDIGDTLYIDDEMQQMLQHYVVGHAFRDNLDEQNRSQGNEELQQYYQKTEEYSVERSQGFSKQVRHITYRPMG